MRCIAASMVIVHHTEQIRYTFNKDNTWNDATIRILGPMGVVLFFVLSGFLITYLLLKEQAASANINVRNFYTRRILRIWPLYYLIVILSFFILPHLATDQLYTTNWRLPANMGQQLLLYVLMLPNFAVTIGLVPYATQLWSVGVEEQFYLIWPWLMKFAKNRINILLAICLSIIVLYMVVPVIFTEGLWPLRIKKILSLIPVNCMAIGGLAAIVVFDGSGMLTRIKSVLFHKATQLITLSLLFILLAKGVTFADAQSTIYASLFAIAIMNLACNPRNILNLEYRWLNRLGRISYGMYMYHPLMIVIALRTLSYFNVYSSMTLYLFSFALTIFVAALSYRYLEKFFLSFKSRYATIVSGDSASKADQ